MTEILLKVALKLNIHNKIVANDEKYLLLLQNKNCDQFLSQCKLFVKKVFYIKNVSIFEVTISD